MLDELLVWVDVVQDGISIDLVTSCEDNNLEIFVCLVQTFNYVWSHINTSIDSLLTRKINLKDYVSFLSFNIVYTMYESLIHIEHHKFLFV